MCILPQYKKIQHNSPYWLKKKKNQGREAIKAGQERATSEVVGAGGNHVYSLLG